MGGLCSKDDSVDNRSLDYINNTNLRVSQDKTLVLPDFNDMKNIIKQKANEMDIDITRSQRGYKSSDQSLILSACRGIPATTLIRYYLVYSFYIAKYTDKKGNKK